MQVQRRVNLLPPEPQGGEMPVTRTQGNAFFDYVMTLKNRILGIITQLTGRIDVQEQTVALQGERIGALEGENTLLKERIEIVAKAQKLEKKELRTVRKRVVLVEDSNALLQEQIKKNAVERERLARQNAELEAANQANERALRENQRILERTTTLNGLEKQLNQVKSSQVATNLWANPLVTLGGGAAFGIPFGPPGMIIGGIGSFVLSFFGIQLGYGHKKAQIQRQINQVRQTH